MENKFGNYQPSLKAQAKIEKSRTISDAELLKGGAEYVVDKKGNKVLKVANRQSNDINEEHIGENERERRRSLYEYVQQEGFKRGDKIKIKFLPNKDKDFSKLGWSYINPGLSYHNIKTGDEKIFYLPTEPVHADCIIASVVSIEQLDGMTEDNQRENIVEIHYYDIESAEKIEK